MHDEPKIQPPVDVQNHIKKTAINLPLLFPNELKIHSIARLG
jgi:hypothetical protein